MNIIRCLQTSVLWGGLVAGLAFAQEPGKAALDTGKIEQLTGLKGQLDSAEQVFKVSAPRTDLQVKVAGVKMIPPMGLTSWAAFKAAGDAVMLMGDLVLREDQVNPVLSAALDNGIEVTALHNHFLWDTPRLMFMHIGGTGEMDKLAAGVGKVFGKLKETGASKSGMPHAALDVSKTSLDPKPIEAVIGAPVEKAGPIFKVTIGRTTQVNGHEMGKSMGINTWAAFAGSNEKAVVDGDFAMLESELQGVLKALRGGGISITTIHQHMIGESPRILLLHFWGTGPVFELARTIKAALDTQAKT